MYSIKEYLHEKAEESRHNETAAYLMFIAGAVFFVGGLLATIIYSGDNLNWFIFLPYNLTSHPASFLGLTLTLSGIGLSIYGVMAGILYARKRAFYMQQLYQAHSFVEKSLINTPKRKGRRKANNKVGKSSR